MPYQSYGVLSILKMKYELYTWLERISFQFSVVLCFHNGHSNDIKSVIQYIWLCMVLLRFLFICLYTFFPTNKGFLPQLFRPSYYNFELFWVYNQSLHKHNLSTIYGENLWPFNNLESWQFKKTVIINTKIHKIKS